MPQLTLQHNIPLAPLTTLGLGGAAEHFVKVSSSEELAQALAYAQAKNWPVLVLGGGSNLVIADDGWAGLVIQLAMSALTFRSNSTMATVTAGAGVVWDELVARAVAQGLSGIECLSGIPGSVGASPIQNIGAYGQEVATTIAEVQVMAREAPYQLSTFAGDECEFSYRNSRFKKAKDKSPIVVGVTFELPQGGEPHLAYRDLKTFADSPTYRGCADVTARLQAVRQEVLRIRRQKSMVVAADDPNSKSAGSFFTNPILTKEEFSDFCLCTGIPASRVPFFESGDQIKVPAAWLVEMAGFKKGMRYKGVGISEAHALALINVKGTTADLLELAGEIRKEVHRQFGIRLQQEPVSV